MYDVTNVPSAHIHCAFYSLHSGPMHALHTTSRATRFITYFCDVAFFITTAVTKIFNSSQTILDCNQECLFLIFFTFLVDTSSSRCCVGVGASCLELNSVFCSVGDAHVFTTMPHPRSDI